MRFKHFKLYPEPETPEPPNNELDNPSIPDEPSIPDYPEPHYETAPNAGNAERGIGGDELKPLSSYPEPANPSIPDEPSITDCPEAHYETEIEK